MKRIGAIIPAVFREIASNEQTALIFIQEMWPQMVGKDLAAKALPTSLKNRTLTLNVHDRLWATQIESFLALIRSSVNDFWDLCLVERIEIKVRPKH